MDSGRDGKGELLYKQAQYRYGIQGRSTVFGLLGKPGILNWSIPKVTGKEKTPEQRIKELETAPYPEKAKEPVALYGHKHR